MSSPSNCEIIKLAVQNLLCINKSKVSHVVRSDVSFNCKRVWWKKKSPQSQSTKLIGIWLSFLFCRYRNTFQKKEFLQHASNKFSFIGKSQLMLLEASHAVSIKSLYFCKMYFGLLVTLFYGNLPKKVNTNRTCAFSCFPGSLVLCQY